MAGGYGNGAPIVVVKVTPHQGGQESCPQGEVEQGIILKK